MNPYFLPIHPNSIYSGSKKDKETLNDNEKSSFLNQTLVNSDNKDIADYIIEKLKEYKSSK